MTLHTRIDIKTLQICEKKVRLLESLGGQAKWREGEKDANRVSRASNKVLVIAESSSY